MSILVLKGSTSGTVTINTPRKKELDHYIGYTPLSEEEWKRQQGRYDARIAWAHVYLSMSEYRRLLKEMVVCRMGVGQCTMKWGHKKLELIDQGVYDTFFPNTEPAAMLDTSYH